MNTTSSIVSDRGVLETFIAHLPATHAEEPRRQDMRHPISAPLPVGVVLGGNEFKVLYRGWLTDLSLHGMAFLTEKPMPTQTCVMANLEPLLGHRCLLGMRIIYCQKVLPHTYRNGAVFLDES